MAASAVVFQGPEAWPKLKRGGKLSGPEQLVKVGDGWAMGLMGLRVVFQVGMDVFLKGDFLSKNFREDRKSEEMEELKSWWFLWWRLVVNMYQHRHFGKAGWLEVLFCKELPTFAQQWNRKREVCSSFMYFLVLGRRIKRTFAPSEPYQPWLCPICGTFAAQSQQGGLLDRACWILGRKCRSLWWIWWWIKQATPKHSLRFVYTS